MVEYWKLNGPGMLVGIASALAILFFGRLAARILVAGLRKVAERSGTDPILVRFLGNIVYSGMLCLVVLAALERIGVNTTTFAAVIAAAGLAIGFALQGSLSNFASGVMLILFRHFREGDLIEAGGQKGIVREVQIFWTILEADDGTKIVCPNAGITGGVIKVLRPAAVPAVAMRG